MRLKGRRRVVRAGPPSAPKPAAPPTLPLEEAWAEATRLFSNRRGMKVRGNLFWFVSERAFPDRFARVTTRPAGKRATHLLGLLSDADLRLLHARAAISHEQAVAGTRFTLIANVSVPLGLVVLLNAVMPGMIGRLVASETVAAIMFVALAAAILFYEVWYCYAGVQQARDLYHLATLEMARRGLDATALEAEQNAAETKL